MVNIKSSGTKSGRDFTPSGGRVHTETFIDLYNEVMVKIRLLSQINDQTTFNIELNKIRKKAQQLINNHFEQSLSQLKTNPKYKPNADENSEKLAHIIKALAIK
ncbi:MAG: hypothetical protein ACO3K7_06445 [Candidatus Marinamargulisbacteria bacterium]